MIQRQFRVVVIFFLAVFCVSLVNLQPIRAQQDYEPIFEDADCQIEVPRTLKVRCGYLIVPENRSIPSGNQIRVHVLIVKSKARTPLTDPVVYLEGGPGGSGVLSLDLWRRMTLFNEIISRRDFILVDQRGTGFSEPSLNCIELDRPYRNRELAVRNCRARLVREGIDLSAYNSAENAADINDLRIALGLKKVNLFGISYGTKLALTVVRDHPEGVRSVILDAVYPLQVNLVETLGPNTIRAFDTLFKGCAASKTCSKAFPELSKAFYELVGRLNEEPAVVKFTDPTTRETVEVEITGDDIVDDLFLTMYDTQAIPLLPRTLYRGWKGDLSGIKRMHDGTLRRLQTDEDELLDLEDSEGMHFSVECREEVPFSNQDAVLKALSDAPNEIKEKLIADAEYYFKECKLWNIPAADEVENEPVVSDLPTLIFNGEYDPITPPEFGAAVAKYLKNSSMFTFPGVGHSAVGTSRCADQILMAFLNTPTRKPDGSCVKRLPAPTFRTR